MSIVAAVHRKGSIWVGSDTMTNMRDALHENGRKWVLAPDGRSGIGHAGHTMAIQIMRRNSKRLAWGKEPGPMRRSLARILSALPVEDKLLRAVDEKDDAVSSYQQSWIYACAVGVFYIGGDLSIVGPEPYAAVGSGAQFALGAAFAMDGEGGEETIKRMIGASIRWNVWCGGVWTAKLDVARRRRK